MSFYNFLRFISIVVLWIGCVEPEQDAGELIRVDLTEDKITKAGIINIIPLETGNESLFSEAKRVALVDTTIFILDQLKRKNLLGFNNRGAFLRALPVGKGVGEVMQPVDFVYDAGRSTIKVFDAALMRTTDFDLNMSPLTSTDYDSRYIRSFRQLADRQWLVHYQTNEVISDEIYSYLVYSPDFKTCTDTILVDRYDHKSMMLSNSISRENAEVLFCRPYDQRIYTYQNGEVAVKYQIQFDRFNITPDHIEEGVEVMQGLFRKGELINMVGDIINNDRFFACTFSLKRKRFYVIYDKVEKKVGITPDTSVLPYGLLKSTRADREFVLLVEPEELHNYADQAGLDLELYNSADVKGGDNPVLVVFEPGS